MEPVQFNCPHCSGLFQVDPSMAGGQVLCPSCHGTVAIPEISAPPSSEPPAQTDTQLSCPLCTGVFLVTPGMAGQQVGCPHCSGQVMIPNEIAAHGLPAPPVAASDPPPQVSGASFESIAPVSKAATSAGAERGTPEKSIPAAAADSNLYPPGLKSGVNRTTDRSQTKPDSPMGNATSPTANDPRYAPATSRQQKRTQVAPNAAAKLPPADGNGGADSLLPPGADATSSDSGGQQRALPESDDSRPVKVAKDFVIPTEDGGVVTLHEPDRVVGEGAKQVRLHTLTSEQKTRRRSFKSLIAWLLCVLVLIGAMIYLLKK